VKINSTPRNQPFTENKPVSLISFVIFLQPQCLTSVRKFIGLLPFALRPLRTSWKQNPST
jgi:hypothetical protein